jgi:hypothetical protein
MKTDLLTMSPTEFCLATKACGEGSEFALKYSSMHEVWEKCPNLSWHLWIIERLPDRPLKQLRLFAVWCARNTPLKDGRTTLALLKDPRSVTAIDVAERFANGLATKSELNEARQNAYAAACAAYAYAAADAYAYAYAAVDAAAYAAACAAAAAAAAADAAADDAAACAYARINAKSAQLAQFKIMVPNPFPKP